MTGWSRSLAALAAAAFLALPPTMLSAQAPAGSTPDTLGAGLAGESSTRTTWVPPTGPGPRLSSGKPDFSGVCPVYYSKPWTNERTFTLTNGELLEYSCEENNRSLWEGRIKLWTPPGTEPLRTPAIGAK